jgi:predicted nucleic acid-binding protein
MSVVTLLELAHGVARANTLQRRNDRQRLLTELTGVVPVAPVTVATALRAGRIDGERRAQGISIPLSDLLIGVTALELDYAVATHNVRHFRLIPNLPVRPL